MKPLHFAAATLIGLGCNAFPLNAAAAEYCVPLENGGSICGETQSANGKEYSVFKGIQYATAERWQAAKIYPSYQDNYSATNFGAMCPQLNYPGPPDGNKQDENCLFLNIWTPKTEANSKDKLPVMIFIHGGGFISGASNAAYPTNPPKKKPVKVLYDGTSFATEQNVILVTLNYRLGALGFLDFGPNGPNDSQNKDIGGNYGLQDQAVALEWIKEHLTAFGGDISNITLFGESAGAMSTGLHLLATDKTEGLFNAAIMESNPLGYTYRSKSEGQEQAVTFLNCLKAVTIKEAKNNNCNLVLNSDNQIDFTTVSTQEIIKAQSRFMKHEALHPPFQVGLPGALPFAPIIDGTFLTKQPAEAIFNGSPKPLMLGFNKDEGVYFANLPGIFLSPKAYKKRVSLYFDCAESSSNCSKSILSTDVYQPNYRFPKGEGKGLPDRVDNALSNLINDYAFACSNMAANYTKSDQKVWAYYFTQVDEIQDLPHRDPLANNVCGPHNRWANSCHAAELPFVFNTLPSNSSAPMQELAKAMNTAWATFAKNYKTTGPDKSWKPWQKATSTVMPNLHLLNGASVSNLENIFQTQHCTAWLNEWRPKTINYNTAQKIR